MTFTKLIPAALLLVCAGCPADDDGETTGATATETDPTTTSTTATTTTASTSTETASSSASSSEDGSSGTTDDTAPSDSSGSDSGTGHDGSTGHDSGSSSTGASLCEILGEGCHDNETDEGQACHLIGHDGDEAACEKAFDMCAEICGL